MYRYKIFQSLEDYNHETTKNRIGRRIRSVRIANGLTQEELGNKVGLNANRIQQYENGARNPKLELCQKIAAALGVETSALLDPQVADSIGAMYAFFEMETLYDLRLKEIDGQIYISFGESQLDPRVSIVNEKLKLWHERRIKMEEALLNAKSEEDKLKILNEYHKWEWNFPFSAYVPNPKEIETTIENAFHDPE